uniref:Uncharacterized protein n=1 Tax=Sphaerodactylus townsendi TaxID=933632 RepID=A0ACB8G7T8_9SAUR
MLVNMPVLGKSQVCGEPLTEQRGSCPTGLHGIGESIAEMEVQESVCGVVSGAMEADYCSWHKFTLGVFLSMLEVRHGVVNTELCQFLCVTECGSAHERPHHPSRFR